VSKISKCTERGWCFELVFGVEDHLRGHLSILSD